MSRRLFTPYERVEWTTEVSPGQVVVSVHENPE